MRSGGLAVAVSLCSTVPGSCAMPPTLLGKELNYYSPHKGTTQRPTALWVAVDSQPNIWWCPKIQAAAVLEASQAPAVQNPGLSCRSLRDRSCRSVLLGRPLMLTPGSESQANVLKKGKLIVNFLERIIDCLVCVLNCWQNCSF